MLGPTMECARELVHEIWDVDQKTEQPAVAVRIGQIAERLSNFGAVLIYGIFVAYGVTAAYRAVPGEFVQGFGLLRDKWWFWVGITLIVLTALRFGLGITKTLKRWNVASLVGSLLLFDLVLKQGPPLFGVAGFSPVDHVIGTFGEWQLGEFVQKVMGL